LHVAQLMPLPLTVTCFSKIQIGFTFLVPAHLGSPRQRAVKRVCVCSMQFYDERVGVFVCICLCVCRRSCRRNYARPIFTKFLCMLPTAVARSSSGSIAIRYVLRGFMDDVIFAQTVAASDVVVSLCACYRPCCVVLVASCRGRGERRDWTSALCAGCRGRSLQCAIALSNNVKPRRMHRVQVRGLLLPMFRGLCVLSVGANRELW